MEGKFIAYYKNVVPQMISPRYGIDSNVRKKNEERQETAYLDRKLAFREESDFMSPDFRELYQESVIFDQ